RPRGHCKEVRTILPVRRRSTGEPQIRLVHQRRRVERVVRPLATHALVRQMPEVIVHARQQRVERLDVAVAPAAEIVGEIVAGHRAPTTPSASAASSCIDAFLRPPYSRAYAS